MLQITQTYKATLLFILWRSEQGIDSNLCTLRRRWISLLAPFPALPIQSPTSFASIPLPLLSSLLVPLQTSSSTACSNVCPLYALQNECIHKTRQIKLHFLNNSPNLKRRWSSSYVTAEFQPYFTSWVKWLYKDTNDHTRNLKIFLFDYDHTFFDLYLFCSFLITRSKTNKNNRDSFSFFAHKKVIFKCTWFQFPAFHSLHFLLHNTPSKKL